MVRRETRVLSENIPDRLLLADDGVFATRESLFDEPSSYLLSPVLPSFILSCGLLHRSKEAFRRTRIPRYCEGMASNNAPPQDRLPPAPVRNQGLAGEVVAMDYYSRGDETLRRLRVRFLVCDPSSEKKVFRLYGQTY